MVNGSGIGIAAGFALAFVLYLALAYGERQPLGGASQWSYALSSGAASASKGGGR